MGAWAAPLAKMQASAKAKLGEAEKRSMDREVRVRQVEITNLAWGQKG